MKRLKHHESTKLKANRYPFDQSAGKVVAFNMK